MEYLDVLDQAGNKTGEVGEYNDVHAKGLIHRTVHVWILNSKKELLLQKRGKHMRAYPDYWDISASGHVSAGQTSLEAARRETKEELGLNLLESDFQYLFTVEDHLVLDNGLYINNEFQDVFIVKKDIDISQVKPTDGEVEGVRFLTLEELKKIMNQETELIVPHKEEYEKLVAYI